MFKTKISKYNINNLDCKIFILFLKNYLFYLQLNKKLKNNMSFSLILKYKQIINTLYIKKYND